ncbi:MAG: hypothetical protein QGH60_24805, partial [Phycisphaerae bacterium]|nr:hypothetical protein [Phycisphaerae bacterium]
MIAAIKRWLAERKRRDEAVQIAWDCFDQAHPGETLAYGPIGEQMEGDTYVVIVPYGATEPLNRSLWRVDMGSQTAEELCYEQFTPGLAELIEMIEAVFDGVPKPQ